jgi:hypothetical protein
LDAFARGVVWGMNLAGAKREDIAEKVTKKDGTPPKLHAIDVVIAKMKAEPEWRGADSSGGGRPCKLTDKGWSR